MKNLPFESLHQAAIGVQRGCDASSMPELHLMPYSRFSAEDSSLWWLCRTKSRCTFNQGKFVLGKPDRFGIDSGIVVGLHVERGVKQIVGHPEWKLSPEWKWNGFVSDMGSAVPAATQRASKILGTPLELFVFASTDGANNSDRVHFTSSGPSLQLERADIAANLLSDVSACGSWEELSRKLESLPSAADWYWVEVFIVTPFSLDPTNGDDMGVCVEMLECFQDWLGISSAPQPRK